MPRKSKGPSAALNIRPRKEIVELFSDYADEMGWTKTMAFERIVSAYIAEHKNEDSK